MTKSIFSYKSTSKINLNHCKSSIVVIILIMLFLIVPYVLFGKNCVITIHDNLDCNLPWFKYVRDNNYFFDIDTASTTLDNISTLYFAGDFTYKSFIYYLFDDFVAYTIIYITSLLLGFISMSILLSDIFNNAKASFIILFVGLMYAALPAFPGYRIAVATLPIVILLFRYACDKKISYIHCILYSFVYPFFSGFDCVLVFALGYWFLLMLFLAFKDKKLSFRLLLCFLTMCLSTVLFNLRLFALRFLYDEPLSRELMNSKTSLTAYDYIVNAIKTFLLYFCKGYPHFASLHLYFILPITFLAFIYILNKILRGKISTNFAKLDKYLKIIIICLSIIVFNCIIIVLNDLSILYQIFKLIIPPLAGLSFARLYIINNVLWYIIFASIMIYLFNANFKYSKIIVAFMITVQLIIIVFSNSHYQDSWKSWKYALLNDQNYITYNEFYSTQFFNELKNDIDYNGEISVAVGYHPSVLMYNGFNTADGYISVYPLKDALKFKELIQPELDVNDWANNYFTSWCGRRYIYNKDISYEPTKARYNGSVELRIDMSTFINHYNGKYIISRAQIANYDDLNLRFVNSYKSENSIYELFVYKTNK